MGSRRRLCSNLRTPRGSLRTTSLGWQFMMSLRLSSKQCCPAPVRNRRLPFVHSAFSLQREFPNVHLWYSTIIKVSLGPYFVKPLGFWVVRLWKEPFNLAFGSHHHSCMPLFIRRTRTFRNPSCRTLFSSLATTPSSSSMMFSGILQLTTYCAVLQFLWLTSFQAGPPQCCCIKPERLDTETSLSICSLDLWRRAPCITVCNTKDLELTVIFLLRLKVAVCPRPFPPLFPLWCLWMKFEFESTIIFSLGTLVNNKVKVRSDKWTLWKESTFDLVGLNNIIPTSACTSDIVTLAHINRFDDTRIEINCSLLLKQLILLYLGYTLQLSFGTGSYVSNYIEIHSSFWLRRFIKTYIL